jgi:hypothetical protein
MRNGDSGTATVFTNPGPQDKNCEIVGATGRSQKVALPFRNTSPSVAGWRGGFLPRLTDFFGGCLLLFLDSLSWSKDCISLFDIASLATHRGQHTVKKSFTDS